MIRAIIIGKNDSGSLSVLDITYHKDHLVIDIEDDFTGDGQDIELSEEKLEHFILRMESICAAYRAHQEEAK